MRDLLPIFQAIEFVEKRLRDEVTVAEIAQAAGYSLYHFIRTFSQVTWHTPYDYLMRRRLSEAAHELVSGERRVIEIALDYRFNNHETFSRAFKRLFGMQPVQWRERGIIPRQALAPRFSQEYLEHIHQAGFERPEPIKMEERRLAGLMGRIAEQAESAERLWRDLGQVKSSCPPEQAGNYFGVISYLDEQGEQAYYLAAGEISPAEPAGPTLACRVLPAGNYIRIKHPAPPAALALTLAYLYHTWLPKAGLQPAYPLEIIDFGKTQPWTNQPASLEIWLPVKNKKDDL